MISMKPGMGFTGTKISQRTELQMNLQRACAGNRPSATAAIYTRDTLCTNAFTRGPLPSLLPSSLAEASRQCWNRTGAIVQVDHGPNDLAAGLQRHRHPEQLLRAHPPCTTPMHTIFWVHT